MSAWDTKATANHDVIREWAEERDAKPTTVDRTGDEEEPGVLRLDFPGYSGDDLEEISWDAFFEKFDEKELAMLYQEKLKSGETSRFFKFVDRDTAREAADEWVD